MAIRTEESFHLGTLLDLVGSDGFFAGNDPLAVPAPVRSPGYAFPAAAGKGRNRHPTRPA